MHGGMRGRELITPSYSITRSWRPAMPKMNNCEFDISIRLTVPEAVKYRSNKEQSSKEQSNNPEERGGN